MGTASVLVLGALLDFRPFLELEAKVDRLEMLAAFEATFNIAWQELLAAFQATRPARVTHRTTI